MNNHSNSEATPREQEEEYSSQIQHTIWELERAAKKGRVSDATRRVLLEAHTRQLQIIEGRGGIAPEGRSFLLMQKRPAPGMLILSKEGEGCDNLHSVARHFHRSGLNVLTTSLAYRKLGVNSLSPKYWQTSVDEARNRYDMLQHCSNRITVLGVGMSAAVALELAASVRLQAVVAVFPVFHVDVAMSDRLKNVVRKVLPMLVRSRPNWSMQRQQLTSNARVQAKKSSLQLFIVAEELKDGSEAGRSTRFSESLADNAARVRLVPAAQSTSPAKLPEAILDEMAKFLRQG